MNPHAHGTTSSSINIHDLAMLQQLNRSFLRVSDSDLQSSHADKIHDIDSESPIQAPFCISSDATDFMQISNNSPTVETISEDY